MPLTVHYGPCPWNHVQRSDSKRLIRLDYGNKDNELYLTVKNEIKYIRISTSYDMLERWAEFTVPGTAEDDGMESEVLKCTPPGVHQKDRFWGL